MDGQETPDPLPHHPYLPASRRRACTMPGSPEKVVSIEALKRSEQICRTRLANEPGDTSARMKLAWCLFMQALYRAGQESVLSALVSAMEIKEHQGTLVNAIVQEDAAHLFSECLRETSMVLQLSPDARERIDVEKIQALARLSGAGQAVSEAEEAAAQVLSDLLRELQ